MSRGGYVSPVVVTCVSVVLGVGLGGSTASMQSRANAEVQQRARIYTAALAAIENEYVETADQICTTSTLCGSEALVYASIEGMLRTLDPHSSFFDPREYAQMRERQSGKYFGIGISISSVGGDVVVSSLFEGSPAYRAGVRRGDIIARVGAEEAKGWSTQDVVDRVKGPKGTTVDIWVRRPGLEDLIPLTIERDEIRIPTVRTAFMISEGIGYVRLQDFSETTDAELGAALERLESGGLKRLVLDLRNNPGGPLDQAIAVSSRFLQLGQMVVYTRGRIRNSAEDYRVTEPGGYTDVPLVVLVNRGSASASEIVSGSMQDHDRAIIVGETTFGKALVQSVYPIANGAGLALTTGRYYTPSGRMIQRPWDGAFDEYLMYSEHEQDPTRERSADDMKFTDNGRKVYSGGGIEPDYFVAGPVEGFNPRRFSRQVAVGPVIRFAERFAKEGDTRPGSRSAAKHIVAPGWVLTDAMFAEFKQFLASQRFRIDDEALAADETFIRAMIHYEVDVDLFGVEEARRNLSTVDPQLQLALSHFGEAEGLLASPRPAQAASR